MLVGTGGCRGNCPAGGVFNPSGSGQRSAEPAGCHSGLAAEDRGEMALVGEPDLLCDQGEGLVGPSQQRFCALQPTLDD